MAMNQKHDIERRGEKEEQRTISSKMRIDLLALGVLRPLRLPWIYGETSKAGPLPPPPLDLAAGDWTSCDPRRACSVGESVLDFETYR
mmetsp:Transcript_31062/g.66113  ORF Transcript_31062/g.66113 Transcript_31062/m.66113 type:complete len:88 (+) Transcript_31062:437-700(+)